MRAIGTLVDARGGFGQGAPASDMIDSQSPFRIMVETAEREIVEVGGVRAGKVEEWTIGV